MFPTVSGLFAHTAQYPVRNTYVQHPTAKYNIFTLPCVHHAVTTHYGTHVMLPSYPSRRLWYTLLAVVSYVV